MLIKERVLIVDTDPGILKLCREQFSNRYTFDAAANGFDGLMMLSRDNPYPVVVSSDKMPDMNGAEFLAKAAKLAPDTVRMMFAADTDGRTVVSAVNEGKIFHFITKPCPPQDFKKALDLGTKEYRLMQKKRELPEYAQAGERFEPGRDQLKHQLEERTNELIEVRKLLKQEINDRQRAERTLNGGRKIFQLAMDNIPLCIFWKDANSVYLGCNSSYARLVNLPDTGSIVGKSDDALNWFGVESLREFGETAMESNIAGFEVIEEFRKEEGRSCYWDVGSFPFHDEEDTVIGVLGILEDISDKIISEQLAACENSNDGIIKVVQAVIDDLTPSVNSLAVSEEILGRMPQDAALYSYIKMVAEETGRINRILMKLKRIADPSE